MCKIIVAEVLVWLELIIMCKLCKCKIIVCITTICKDSFVQSNPDHLTLRQTTLNSQLGQTPSIALANHLIIVIVIVIVVILCTPILMI